MGSWLIERVMEIGSLIIRKLGGDRAGEIAIHRFLPAPSLTTREMAETLAALTAAAGAGRRIVVAQDTTEINFAGREERPRHDSDRSDPPKLTLHMMEAREINAPADAQPLLWRLLTTLNVTTAAEAQEIVRLYQLLCRIEKVFRALKSDGMRLEETQMHEAARLFKQALVGLAAAIRTMQLVKARDASPRSATDVIDAALLPAAAAIGATLEGKTARQHNPHPRHSLAWLAWITARLGGWNCHYKPPGPKTMRAGWTQFAAMAAGFFVATIQIIV